MGHLPTPVDLLHLSCNWRRTLGDGYVRRRDFIVIAGSAAAWPLAAQAQQSPTPVIGFLRPTKAEESGHLVAAVREGLRESGYPSDKVLIESRWGDGRESSCRNLPENWSLFRWRRLSLAAFRRRGQRRQLRQAFRLFS